MLVELDCVVYVSRHESFHHAIMNGMVIVVVCALQPVRRRTSQKTREAVDPM